VYGNPLTVPTLLLTTPEPEYNYENYQYKIKKQIQESQIISRKNLLEVKNKSKERYDRSS